jgi:hypothetical protein
MTFEGCHGTGYLTDLSDSGSGASVYCDCPAGRAVQYCLSVGYFDAGRGDESHTCERPPKHDGDHGCGWDNQRKEWSITWRSR